MTTTTETATIARSPSGFNEDSPEWQAHVAEALEKERLFDATRPPCPTDWCNAECEINLHFGTSITHPSDEVTVACTPETMNPSSDAAIKMWAWRTDELGKPSEPVVILNFDDAELLDDSVGLTPAQCRNLAAELQRHANLLDPEHEVPSEQVRVGDLLPVGAEWLYVYGVLVDEPSNNVQISTTVDRETWPELDGDEDPHMFEPGDIVRIRRGAR